MRHEALSSHLENLFHVKELGSILLRHPGKKKKKFRIWRPHGSGFISDSSISTLESVFKKLRIRQRIHWIRVDGASVSHPVRASLHEPGLLFTPG